MVFREKTFTKSNYIGKALSNALATGIQTWLAMLISAFIPGFGSEEEKAFELLLNETLTYMKSGESVVRIGRHRVHFVAGV